MAVVDSHQPYLPVFAPASPFYSEEHEAFRSTVRRFVEREIMPHVDQWDEAEEFPRELYKKASAAGRIGDTSRTASRSSRRRMSASTAS